MKEPIDENVRKRTTRSKPGNRKLQTTRSTRNSLGVGIQKQNRKFNKKILLASVLAFTGIILLVYQPAVNHLIGPIQLERVQANALSADTVQENINRFKALAETETSEDINSLFDYESVNTIDTLDMTPTIDTGQVVGGIYIPGVDMLIPILYGVSQDTLLTAAGTMKPDQEMGVGNYALIGHNSKNPDVLFAPVHRIADGDTMFVTDKQAIYEYKFTEKRVVKPSDIHVINDIEGQTTLTLITCTADGAERVVVQGELVALYHYSAGDEDVIHAFDAL